MVRNLGDSEKIDYIVVGILIGIMIGFFIGLAVVRLYG